MDVASIALALVAGILSPLSPCVLPLLPVVLGAALTEHRLGPLALAGGLASSFAGVGLFIATVGFSLGFDSGVFRSVAAILLMMMGVVLLLPQLQARFAVAAGPVSNWAEQRFSGLSMQGFGGQFAVGLLLGAVWSPCVGPTLGAASLLAAQGQRLGEVAITMLAFGVGAGIPLLLLGHLSREALMRWRDRLLSAGRGGRLALGLVLVATGSLILGGYDRKLEASLVKSMPAWLLDLTTRF